MSVNSDETDAAQITHADTGQVTEAAVETRNETNAVVDKYEPVDLLTTAELPETSSFWYRAASIPGDIYLYVEAVSPLPTANELGSALVLGQVEPLCQALECWLGVSLEIEPSSAVEQKHTWRLSMLPLNDSGAITDSTIALDVYLPAGAIYTLPAIPEVLSQSVEFRWREVSAGLSLAPVMLTNTECDKLLGGSVLLLPGSSDANWACQLSVFDGCISLAALFEPENAVLTVQSPAAKAQSATPLVQGDRIAVELLLQQPLILHAGNLAGSFSGPCVTVPAPLGDLIFLCMCNGRKLASGHIGPLGQGFALFVSQPDEYPEIHQTN